MTRLVDELTGFPDSATATLYRRAVAEQWNVHRDVEWSGLSLEVIALPIRQAMAEIYAQTHYGEVITLRACGRLLDSVPEGWVRQLIATQTMDEARHVEFFSIVLDRLEHRARPLEPIERLGAEMEALHSPAEALVAMHVLEGAAHTMFVTGARQSQRLLRDAIRLPGSAAVAGLLSTIVNLVGRDESRHIALGLRCLKELVPRMPRSDRHALEARTVQWCTQVRGLIDGLNKPLLRLGLSPRDIQQRIWRVQRHDLMLIGLDIGDPPLLRVDDSTAERRP